MKRVYIAGKISGMEKEAFKLFEEAEQQLIKRGFEVVNPMKLPHNHNKTWSAYMTECITEMIKCHLIYSLPNWSDSTGARIEVGLARELGIKIIM